MCVWKMLLWKKVQRLPVQEKRLIYKKYNKLNFPIDVRHYLASWIEQFFLDSLEDRDCEEMKKVFLELLHQLHKIVQDRRHNSDSSIKRPRFPGFVKYKLEKSLELLQNLPPVEGYERLLTCLLTEADLVTKHDENGGGRCKKLIQSTAARGTTGLTLNSALKKHQKSPNSEKHS